MRLTERAAVSFTKATGILLVLVAWIAVATEPATFHIPFPYRPIMMAFGVIIWVGAHVYEKRPVGCEPFKKWKNDD